MNAQATIPVLLSRASLGMPIPPPQGRVPADLKLEAVGVTYSMAQETRWVDPDTFAIGRWDGTLTLFGPPPKDGDGPKIESASVSPAWAGLEMITPLGRSKFVTSNDAGSLVVWDLSAQGLAEPADVLRYDSKAGVANSGTLLRTEREAWLVTGHASGRLLVWSASRSCERFELLRAVDIRSPAPVPSPYELRNVRVIAEWRDQLVLAGGEDGDLCLVRIPTGEITCRLRFNPAAQRGINDLALLGDDVLVGSCSVGPADSNTWAYRIEAADRIVPVAHVDLVRDTKRPQVFNFSVELARVDGALLFLCATEEGLLWSGELRAGTLQVHGHTSVSSGMGAAISLQRESGVLAVVGDHVHLFRLA